MGCVLREGFVAAGLGDSGGSLRRPGRIREAVGGRVNHRQRTEIQGILESSRDPDLRKKAAYALGRIRPTTANGGVKVQRVAV